MNYIFEKIIPSTSNWKELESSVESTCFHSKQWSEFTSSLGYKLFFAKISYNDNTIAYFIGQQISLGLISIIASPLEGCGYTQGLCFINRTGNTERVEVYKQLSKWIFSNHFASMLQIDDWQLRNDYDMYQPLDAVKIGSLDSANILYELRPTLYVNLNKREEELWSGLHYKSCKYCINKANKLGLRVEFIENKEEIENFCSIHYSHLVSVCKSKGMKPKPGQSEKRMVKLCKALYPNRVLMLKVIGSDSEGKEQNMSSAIFCFDKGECIYWTGASFQQFQKYCPNELMVWEAMKAISRKGGGDLNFGGMASYKLKFGTKYAYVPRLVFQKYPCLYESKALAKKTYYAIRKFIASINLFHN